MDLRRCFALTLALAGCRDAPRGGSCVDDAPLVAACPANPPAQGAPCPDGSVNLECEWGGDPDYVCNYHARCSYSGCGKGGGTCGTSWYLQFPAPECTGRTCSPCEATPDVLHGRPCNATGFCVATRGLCFCNAHSDPVWRCPEPEAGCPDQRPLVGSACTVENQVCNYGAAVLCASDVRCSKGTWRNETWRWPGCVVERKRKRGGAALAAADLPSRAYIDRRLLCGPSSTDRLNQLCAAGSYRVDDGDGYRTTFTWFDVSHIAADAAMARLDPSSRDTMDETFDFLRSSALWDRDDPNGGWFASSDVEGRGGSPACRGGAGAPCKYTDDNALAGIAFLDAAEVSDGARRDAYVEAARRAAQWLLRSGARDATFGGGFWWRSDHDEKPTQASALAALLFARLYLATGDAAWRDQARATMTWLDQHLYDRASGLYAWKLDRAGAVEPTKFSYDQAIVIEALLADERAARADGDRRAAARQRRRAERLAGALATRLWDRRGGFALTDRSCELSPVFSGWVSRALARLHAADGNPRWLELAEANVRAIDGALRDGTTGAYYPLGCGDRTALSRGVVQSVDQAWMLQVKALIAVERRRQPVAAR